MSQSQHAETVKSNNGIAPRHLSYDVGSSFAHPVYLRGILVRYVYESHRVKV